MEIFSLFASFNLYSLSLNFPICIASHLCFHINKFFCWCCQIKKNLLHYPNKNSLHYINHKYLIQSHKIITKFYFSYFIIFLGKHSGQLKRISGTVINLIQFLLNLEVIEDDGENIFYERFIQFSVKDLNKINFYRHIGVNKNEKNKVKNYFKL